MDLILESNGFGGEFSLDWGDIALALGAEMRGTERNMS